MSYVDLIKEIRKELKDFMSKPYVAMQRDRQQSYGIYF